MAEDFIAIPTQYGLAHIPVPDSKMTDAEAQTYAQNVVRQEDRVSLQRFLVSTNTKALEARGFGSAAAREGMELRSHEEVNRRLRTVGEMGAGMALGGAAGTLAGKVLPAAPPLLRGVWQAGSPAVQNIGRVALNALTRVAPREITNTAVRAGATGAGFAAGQTAVRGEPPSSEEMTALAGGSLAGDVAGRTIGRVGQAVTVLFRGKEIMARAAARMTRELETAYPRILPRAGIREAEGAGLFSTVSGTLRKLGNTIGDEFKSIIASHGNVLTDMTGAFENAGIIKQAAAPQFGAGAARGTQQTVLRGGQIPPGSAQIAVGKAGQTVPMDLGALFNNAPPAIRRKLLAAARQQGANVTLELPLSDALELRTWLGSQAFPKHLKGQPLGDVRNFQAAALWRGVTDAIADVAPPEWAAAVASWRDLRAKSEYKVVQEILHGGPRKERILDAVLPIHDGHLELQPIRELRQVVNERVVQRALASKLGDILERSLEPSALVRGVRRLDKVKFRESVRPFLDPGVLDELLPQAAGTRSVIRGFASAVEAVPTLSEHRIPELAYALSVRHVPVWVAGRAAASGAQAFSAVSQHPEVQHFGVGRLGRDLSDAVSRAAATLLVSMGLESGVSLHPDPEHK